MSETIKPVRLSKLAREFNVGISTIVDYLETQGVEVDSNPNTKIEGEVYGLLLAEFRDEKETKQEAKSQVVTKEKRETVSLEPAVKETPVVEEETPKPAEDVIRAKAESEVKVQVVGKIDLKTDKPKETPKAAEVTPEPEAEKAPVEEKAPEPKAAEEAKPAASEKPAAKEAPKAPAAKEKKEEEKPTGPGETIKAQARKLTGPTVVGKIELPVEKEKSKPKPIASSNDNDDRKKRKRKRIKKVDVSSGGNNRGGDNRNQNRGKKGKPGGGPKKPEVTAEEIQKEIKDTLARLSGGGKSKSAKMRRAKRDAVSQRMEEEAMKAEAEKSILKVTEFVTVSELASMMSVGVNDIIGACMSLGIFVSINQRLDAETLSVVAEEFGFSVDFVSAEVQETIIEEEDREEDMVDRSPIVTVMGHVDHGKTSLLDYVRKANVIAGEAGGITQHIGAYKVMVEGGKEITFLDTPGHEAFTAMRARGAQVTDLAIIVVSADDNVMPQTIEAINHSQAAGVPMVFAINKIDKDGANPDRIREELANMNILLEDWGGKFQSQEISAKHGTNIEELLEKVLLEAELLELKANPKKRAIGTVIESSLDKGRGYVTTLLVEAGTMRVGDVVLAGRFVGKVKAMYNERGSSIKEAGPATPVSLLGLNGAPNAGDRFHVMEDEREAKNIATKRQQLQREQGIRTQKHITLDEIGRRLAIGDFQELNVIVKGDVDGSIEALSDSLQKLSTEEIQVNIIHKAVGQITESDVLLATASDAIIIGFQVRPSASARKLAEAEQIDIRLYSIIYQAIEEIKQAMEGMLSPDVQENVVGTAEVRETFKISKVGMVAGSFIQEGKISRNSQVRVIRDGIVIYTGTLAALKRFKDDVKEVTHGYECGLSIQNFNDLKVGDIIEAFEEIEVKKTL